MPGATGIAFTRSRAAHALPLAAGAALAPRPAPPAAGGPRAEQLRGPRPSTSAPRGCPATAPRRAAAAPPHARTLLAAGPAQILAFHADTPAGLRELLASWPADLAWPELRRRAAASREQWSARAHCRLLIVVHQERTSLATLLQQARTLLDANREQAIWRS